nr:hypothetical protein BaRGS_034115 [Batillaria attramentaria]
MREKEREKRVGGWKSQQDGHFDEELHTVCPELKSVLKDAKNRYVVFDETKDSNGERLWESLCTYMTELAKPPTSPPPPQWHDIVIVTVVVFMIGVLLVFVLLILHDSYAAIAVVDTPDINNLPGWNEEKKKAEVDRWKDLSKPGPHVLLLTVRCDVRYTAEEHDIYREVKRLWGDEQEFCQQLVASLE